MHEISLFERILETNIINFIIMVWILGIIAKKIHLAEALQKLADDVKDNVELSAKRVEDALLEYKNAKDSTANLEKEKLEIEKNAKLNAQNLKEKIECKAQVQKDEIKLNLEKTTNAISIKAKDLTVNEMYNSCVELAKSEIENILDDETHKFIIQKNIEEIEKIDGIKL